MIESAQITPAFFALACLGILLTGISKSGFAGGAGVLAVPVLALIIPVPAAAALVLPLLIVMDIRTVWIYRKFIELKTLKRIIPSSMLGVCLAGVFMGSIDACGLQVMLGLFCIVFSCWQTLAPLLGRMRAAAEFWGIISGISSTLMHAGGPPINVYLIARGLPKLQWLATASVFFAVMNVVKLIPYTLNGQWSLQLFKLDLALLPVAFLGVALGRWFQDHISEAVFTACCRALLFVSGIMLLL